MSDIGLDLLRLLGSVVPIGIRVIFCKAAAVTALLGDVGKRGSQLGIPGMPGNLRPGSPGRPGSPAIPAGNPGNMIPGGKNGFWDSNKECVVV